MNTLEAGQLADSLIATEIGKQDAMWGVANDRADSTKGQLFDAAQAQLEALRFKDFDVIPKIYPADWSGFRDYGSDVSNLVVAISFLRQEIKRKLANGESYVRTSRTAPYSKDQPNKI